MEAKTEGAETPASYEEGNPELDKQSTILIEAALYVAGRPLDLKTLCSITGIGSKRKVQSLVRTLMEEYKQRNTALEILELEDQRFVFQLKPDYSLKVRRLAIRPLLSIGPLKTLSYIAYRQPVSQKQVIEARGKHVYSHIRMLREMDLIAYKKDEKNRIIETTDYFADYFGMSHDPKLRRRQIGKIFDDLEKKAEAQGE